MSGLVIALDAMGGDKAPDEIIKGAVMGSGELRGEQAKIILLGREDEINKRLSAFDYDKSLIEVIHAPEVILGTDSPTDAIKRKKDSSMVMGLNLLKKGGAGAFVSAGNTGALMAGAAVIIGRIKGIERPAIGTLIPNKRGLTFLIDSGANADVKPHYLTQFALMGSVYMENILGIESPRVGLINVGSEESKGSELYKQCHALLRDSGLNFIGNIEGTDIAEGKTDVLVCDGFIGNIILKYSEGLSMALLSMIKAEITSSFKSKLAAGVLKGDFMRLKTRFDASEYGGAPLLGLKGLVVKAHGGSDAKAVKNALLQCHSFLKNDIAGKIAEKVDGISGGEQ